MKLFIVGICLLLYLKGYGQIQSEITHYSTKDGLSHDGVLCITRDRGGFMWFGTFDGINRFDGHNFVTYKSRPGDSSKLLSNKIRDIIEDKAGYLWIETFDYKIYRFDKATEQFLAIFEGPYKNLFNDQVVIRKILPDSVNGIWLITKTQGMYHVQSNHLQRPIVTRYIKNGGCSSDIKGNIVKFHFTDANGNIWIGTDGGLNVLKRNGSKSYQVLKFNQETEKLFSSCAFTCATQSLKSLYLGTADGRMLIYDIASKKFTTLNIANGKQLNDICLSRTGAIYISTIGNGLIKLSNGTVEHLQLCKEDNATYKTLYEDHLGNIWIEPDRYGVIKYNPKTGACKHFVQKKDYTALSRNYYITTDANGILWIGMKGGGFGYYNPATDNVDYFFDKPGSGDQKFSNVLTCLYIDPTGVLWMSGKDGGVNKVVSVSDQFNFTQPVNQPKNRSENDSRAMLQDKNGRIWICTKDGLVHVYENKKEINVFGSHTNQIGFVYCITQDSKGNIWLGTKGNGLFKAIPANEQGNLYTLINYQHSNESINSLSGNTIYSVIEDHKGRIWVGAFDSGLNLFTEQGGKEVFKNYTNTFHNYPYPWAKAIRHLCEDNKGRIWIGTSYGLVVFNPDESVNGKYDFITYHKIPGDAYSLGNNSIQYIIKDYKGQIWLGTFGGGLSKVLIEQDNIRYVRFKAFTRDNGLPNDVILSMTVDRQNNLWIATAGGLAKFNPQNELFKNYSPFHDLTKTGFSEATCFSGSNGILYFGCLNGYLSFNPQSIINKRMPANIALTNIQLYYKDLVPGSDKSPLKYAINETQLITLKHDQNAISIDYAVLDYRATNKISYSYKLEEFDKTWHAVNGLQKAVYTNLPPGSYTFYVKGENDDMLSNAPQKSLRIVIKPPYYLTVWAYAVYIILTIAAIILARKIMITMIKLRNKVIVEQRLIEAKLEFFTNMSHELRTPLTLIASPLEELSVTEKLSEKGSEYFKIINRNVNRMIRFTNQLLDFRKIQSGKMQINITETDLVGLVNEVSDFFTAVAEEKNINFQIRSKEQKLYAWVDEEKIEIILYNLISNAFKFSPPNKNIVLKIENLDRSNLIEIRVIDEGTGVPATHLEDIFELYHEEQQPQGSHLKGTGIGLALARGLAASHKGKLWAQLNESEGMTLVLQLQAGYAHFTQEELNFSGRQTSIEPVKEVELKSQIPERNTQVNFHPSLILIVEDNPDLSIFLKNKLSSFYQVLTAADGAEGLKAARSTYPDLIISDVVMPVMDGIQMLDTIRHDQTVSHIPVILLTAKSSIESRINGLKYGADVYLTKPFSNELLMASIENLLVSRKMMFERFALNAKENDFKIDEEAAIPVTTSKDGAFLKDVIKIVEDKMGDHAFNIDEVASGMGMGRTTFYKKLKSLSSLSPVEFVRELRLKRSKQLLDTGEYTVSEAGYMAGFNSLAYFSTCFKEKYQVSPSSYLKKIKAESV